METIDVKLKHFLHGRFKRKLLKCLWPGNDCDRKAIKAHSIQNKRIIDSISSNGHVIMPTIKIDFESGPDIDFKLVGKNRATTFTGLCAYHDNYLFKDIDNNEIDLSNPKHLFLLAYRSVLKETHTCLKTAQDVQVSYLKAIELGKFSADEINNPMIFATLRLKEAYHVFMYKSCYDSIYFGGNWNRIKHKVLRLPHNVPVVAASSLLSCNAYFCATDEPVYVAFNIFPKDKQFIIIFSFLDEHEAESTEYYVYLEDANEHILRYEISKLILRECENFVLSPKVWRSFSSCKRELMMNYFRATIIDRNLDLDDEELCFL